MFIVEALLFWIIYSFLKGFFDFFRKKALLVTAVKKGNEAWFHGNYPQALSSYQQALDIGRQLSTQEGIASCLAMIGVIYYRQGDFSQAFSRTKEALHIYRQLDDQKGVASCLSFIAVIYQVWGNFSQALSHFQQALDIGRSLLSPKRIVGCLSGIGIIYFLRGDCDQTLSYFCQGLDIYRQLGDQKGIAGYLTTVASIYYAQGDYPQFLSHCQQALDIYCQLDDQKGIAICLSLIGHIYKTRGAYAQALSYCQQALDIYCQLDDQKGIAICLSFIGHIHKNQRDYAQALSYCQQALDICRQLSDQRLLSGCLANIGDTYKLQGDYPQALSCYHQALDVFRQLGWQYGIATCLDGISDIYRDQGNHLQAINYSLQALEAWEISRHLRFQEWTAAALNAVGDAYLQQGDRALAYPSFIGAIALVEQMRQKAAGGRQQQIGLFERFLDPYFSVVEGVLWSKEDYGQALEYVERSKARTLVELLAEQDLLPTGAVPPELVEEYKRLRRRQREIDFWLEQHGDQQEQRATAKRAERQEVAGEMSSLLEKIKEYDPAFTATVRVEPISARDIQGALPDEHTALVELFLGREKTLAFLVTAAEEVQGVEVRDCPASEVRVLAEKWLAGYAEFRGGRGTQEAWCQCIDEVLSELYSKLFVPIKQALPPKVRRLIFVPHLHFHLFPLHAMYREENGGRVYLIEEYEEVSYAPSAAILIRCQQRRRPVPKRFVAVENPTGDLKHAKDEVRAAAALSTEYVILGPDGDKPATKKVLLEEASHANVVLVVTHSSSGDPRSAHIKLSFGEELTLVEHFLHLDVPECSLWDYSSCEPALPQLTRSDEWITLMSAPLYAGAPTVWGGLWVVDDFATAQLKQRAYENLLKRGTNKVQALNEAQRYFLKGEFLGQQEAVAGAAQARFALQQEVQRMEPETPQLTEKHRHPFYWAAFIASGAR